MKQNPTWRSIASAIVASLAMVSSTRADTTITTFDSFNPNALYASWSSATINATPTNYIITATGYGSLWKQTGPPPVDGSGTTNLVLDITLDGTSGADTNLGVIVDLKDADDTQISYRWYGRSRGHHILVGNLFTTNFIGAGTDNGVPVTNNLFRIITNSVGSTPGLNLTALWHLNLELDPYVYTFAPYTLMWNDLKLSNGAGNGGGGASNVCAVVSSFDDTMLNLAGNWSSQVSTPTNIQITATGFGDGWATTSINTDSNKTLQLNVTLTASATANGKLGPIVVLQDADGTQIQYAWYGLNPGTNLTLTKVLGAGAIVAAGSTPGFNFSAISFFHVQLDPSTYASSYTVSWNDLSVTGCTSGGGGDSGICAAVNPFDNASLNLSANWTSQVSTPTNIQITASGFGDGWAPASVNTDSNKTLQLNVTLAAPGTANGKLGPIAVLEDGDGTQMQYAWYGQNPGTNLVLTKVLGTGSIVAAGSAPGFNFATISFLHVQLDPSSYAGSYTVSWNDLSVVGCTNTPPPPGTDVCATIDNFNDDFMGGLYGNWTVPNEVSTATNLQITATEFGGGYHSITPNIITDSNKTLRVDVTLTATTAANGKLGPIVVLEDGDTTQLQYAWYGQNPGNYVLTKPLSSGVNVRAGSTPGFDFSTLSFFHLQLDPSSYSGTYTVAWNNLDLFGCTTVPVRITDYSYDTGSGQFMLTWTSEIGASYAVESTTALGTSFSTAASGVPSGGSTTTISIVLTDPASFIRIRKE